MTSALPASQTASHAPTAERTRTPLRHDTGDPRRDLLCAIACVIVGLRSSRTRPVRPFALVGGVTLIAVALIATLPST